MQKIVIVSHSNNIAATQKMMEIKCKTLSFEVFLLPISRVLAKLAVTRRVASTSTNSNHENENSNIPKSSNELKTIVFCW